MEPHKTFNILLLGETGVGKTTFVNSCANYIRYGTFEEASRNPKILIDVSFSITTPVSRVSLNYREIERQKERGTEFQDYQSRRVVLPSDQDTKRNISGNEQRHTVGESTTQNPLIHAIDFEQGGIQKRMQFIDTPGVNDTRGWEQDEKNFQKILEVIRKVGKLHAICILLKPNESTLTLGFRHSLDHLLVKLHSNSTKNILFCFTNTRSTLYRPGESLPVLQTYLRGVEESSGVQISTDPSNVYCFDNDCFRYLCTLVSGVGRNERFHEMFISGWEKNVTELLRFLNQVQCLVPHLVQDTLSINSVQNAFNQNARILAEKAVNLLVKKRTLELELIQSSDDYGKKEHLIEKEESRSRLYVRQRLDFLRMVCTSVQCTFPIKLMNGKQALMPRAVCHDWCQVRKEKTCCDIFMGCFNVFFRDPNNDRKHLQKCVTFTGAEETETEDFVKRDMVRKCRHCDCSFLAHEQVNYDYVPGPFMTDKDRENILRLKKELQELKGKCQELNNELYKTGVSLQTVRDTVSEISVYLTIHSVKTGTDSFLFNLDRMFDIEKSLETEVSLIEVIKEVRQNYLGKASSITKRIRRGERTTMSAEYLLRTMEV